MNNLIVIIGIILLCAIGLGFWMWLFSIIGIFEEEKTGIYFKDIDARNKNRKCKKKAR